MLLLHNCTFVKVGPGLVASLGCRHTRQEIIKGTQRRPCAVTDRDQDLLTEDGRHITA
jgi:hypothetical protein